MNRPLFMRQTHLLIASALAIAMYISVVFIAFNSALSGLCSNLDPITVGSVFATTPCVLADLAKIVFKVLTIGLPLAVIISALYLKLVKFSLSSAILISLIGNILSIVVIIVLLLNHTRLPNEIMLGLIPLAYLLLGTVKRPRQLGK